MGLSGPRASVFPSRARIRAILPPIGLQAVFREVRTEDELRQALTPKSGTDFAALIANTGRRIVIAAPITLKSPVVIDETLPGTTIESHGYLPIYCGVAGITAFDVRAPLVTLRGLILASPDITGTGSGITFGTAFQLAATADNARILDAHVFGCDVMVDGASGCNRVRVRGCALAIGGSAVDQWGIRFDGRAWQITENELDASGAGVAVLGGASSERSAIVGNYCGGAGIDTSAGLGSNTIGANTLAGTVTAHATDDALGGNT